MPNSTIDQRGEEPLQWWPEHLAVIVPELEGALSRDYIPFALLVEPSVVSGVVHPSLHESQQCAPSRVASFHVDGDGVEPGSKKVGEWYIKRWDRAIEEAEVQGHRVLALLCIARDGDIMIVPYFLDYPERAERETLDDEMERAALEAVLKLAKALGVSYSPMPKVCWV